MAQTSTGEYGYFEHDADVGIVGRGATVERAFESAAAAMFALASVPAGLHARETVRFEFEEADLELALVVWLNRLLLEACLRDLVLCEFHLERDGAHWRGSAGGESWRAGLERGVEVKGATLTALAVTERPGGVEARCVVDV